LYDGQRTGKLSQTHHDAIFVPGLPKENPSAIRGEPGMKAGPLIAVACVLAGCAKYHPQPLSPAASAGHFDSRTLSDPGLKQFVERYAPQAVNHWPPASWDLDSLTLAAFYFHPSLEVARAQWRTAQAGVVTAKGRPNPTLNVSPGYNTSSRAPISPWFPSVSLDVPIETAGKRGLRADQASQLGEAARFSIVTVAWQVHSAVRASLLEYTVAERRVQLLEGQVRSQDQALKLLSQRIAAGELAVAELIPARIALDKARVDLSDAVSQRASAHARLASATGVSHAALDGQTLVFDLNRTAPGSLQSPEARAMALRSRADIRGALAEYAAAESGLALQIAKQYPDFHLAPGYQYDQGQNKWSLGLSVELPILNQNQGPIAEAEARRAESAARFADLQAKIIGEIDRAYATYAASRQSQEAILDLAREQRERRDTVEQQFEAGAADSMEELSARIEADSAALVELDGQFKVQQALGALEDAVQMPLAVPPAALENKSQASKEKSK
jgi:outer membrane protein TolC